MQSGSPELVFLRNEAGEDEGLGNAGIETFRDAPYSSVGRECGQNSADAAAAKPVELRFDVERILASDYPMRKAQLTAVEQCLAKATEKKDQKEIEFFSRARKVLAHDSIALLKIADRNTKGLIGPSKSGTPFHSLVKSTGVTVKEREASGGSFGIGKNAAFAVSELQTVFYSTNYIANNNKEQFLAQGKTILISHRDANGDERRATGYWGMPGFEPVSDQGKVPPWLRRDGIGTSVVVAGFRESQEWQYRIAASLLQNFFCALHREEIRFLLDNESIVIDKATLQQWFNDERVIKAARDTDDLEDFEFARRLYDCLRSPEAINKELNIKGLGPVSVKLLLQDGLPKRVRIVRNGMSITDSLMHFGEKFTSFPMYKDFVAIVEPTTAEGSAFIKRLENPQHNGLSAERILDPEKSAEATKIMRKLARAIRDAIKEQALKPPEKRVTLDELSEFFDAPSKEEDKTKGSEDDLETFTYKVEPPRRRAAKSSGKGAGGAGGAGTGTGGGRQGEGRRRRARGRDWRPGGRRFAGSRHLGRHQEHRERWCWLR